MKPMAVLISIFSLQLAICQQVPLRVQRLSLEEGLSQSSIFAAFQDRDGYLWLGTANGLNRYGGYGFTVFQHDPNDVTSLSNDWITCIGEDDRGRIWVGTRDGLNLYNRATSSFQRVGLKGPGTQGLGMINAVMGDHRHRLWVGTPGGLYLGSMPITGFQRIAYEPGQPLWLTSNFVSSLAETPNGDIWVGTQGGGLQRLDPQLTGVRHYTRIPYPLSVAYGAKSILRWRQALARESVLAELVPKPGESSLSITFDLTQRQEVALICAAEGRDRMFDTAWIVDRNGHIVWEMRGDQSRHGGGSGKNRLQLEILNLAAGHYEAFYVMDGSHGPGDWNAEPPTHFPYGLHLMTVSADVAGQLENAACVTSNPQQIGSNRVSSLYVDPSDGALWVATFGGGLSRLDVDDASWSYWRQSRDGDAVINNEGAKFLDSLFSDTEPVASVVPTSDLTPDPTGFSLSKATPCLVVCYGEGSASSMVDFGSLMREGRVIWTARELGSMHAGGALKNRMAAAGLVLQPGRYSLHYQVDGSHSPNAWNADPGPHADRYGIRVFPISADALNGWRQAWCLPREPTTIANDAVRSVVRDERGRIWVATANGLSVLEGGRSRSYHHDPADPKSLSADDVNRLVCDRSGNLWIGTILGGVSKLTELKQAFHSVGHSPSPGGLPSPLVYAFEQRADGRLWVGTGAGLSLYDPDDHSYVELQGPCDEPPCLSPRIGALQEVDNSQLWVGTVAGLFTLDIEEGDRGLVLRQVGSAPIRRDESGLPHGDVSCLLLDPEGMWIGLRAAGLRFFNFQSKRFEAKVGRNLRAGVVTIARGPEGQIWLGTSGDGVMAIDRDGTVLEHIRRENGGLGELTSNIVSALRFEEDQILWVGTYGGGLNRVDLSSGRIESWTQKHGLPNNVIYAILSPGASLWMSTNRGLARFDVAADRWQNYTVTDGVQSNEFNIAAGLALRDGRCVFGGVAGFTYFDPDDIRPNEVPPDTILTSIKIRGRAYAGSGAVNSVQRLVLDHDSNFITFEFSAMDFTNPALNRYRYQLHGLERWPVDSGTRRFASYTDLDPGNYEFEVFGANSDGVWDTKGHRLKLRILAPFWATTWFHAMIASLVLAIASWIIQTRRVRRRRIQAMRDVFAHELINSRERERRRIAVELHDSLGQNLMAVRNELQRQLKHGTIASDEIRHLPDMVLRSIEEARTISHDLHPHLLDRLGFEKAVRAVTQQMGSASEVEMTCRFRRWPSLAKELEINLYRIVQEALNNIVKHAGAAHAGVVASTVGESLSLEIWDDGRGMELHAEARGLGLTGMQERVRLMGGHFEIIANTGVGTRICVRLRVNGVGERHRE